MKMRALGKTGLMVSEIGVGGWQLGGPLRLDGKVDGHPELGREHCVRLIRESGGMGINFVDTAEQYGAGESERRVGEALEGQREKWIVSTKFGAQVGPDGERLNDASPERVARSLEESLGRLRTDYVDVYLYHSAPKRGPEAERVAELLARAKREGKVRAVGISTNELGDVEYLHGLGCLDVVEYASNIIEPARELREWIARHGAGGVVRGAFYAGRLSGRYFHRGPEFETEDIRGNWFGQGAAEEFGRYRVFEELVTPERGMVQLALRYLLDEPGTSTVIPAGKSARDYMEAVRATEIAPLTNEEKWRLGELRGGILSQRI